MLIRTITLATMMAMSVHLNAQTLATSYKQFGEGNPISGSVFCADPTALEYKGRLYVYGSNDHQQFIKNGKQGENGYGDIKSIVVFSTDDMLNWTFHGTIDVATLCSSWTGNPWYKGFMNSWAPSVTWRTTEDGTDEFFLYFANTSHGVGVLKANSPTGPWKSPLKESMINRDTPGALPCNWIFDPGVVIDENGVGWISFGGGDPNEEGNDIQPNNARIAKLNAEMTGLDGSAVKIPAPYHFEASELNIINGKFVYTYCSSWAGRNDSDWNNYKKENGTTESKPNACTMCYMVSDTPLEPSSWLYKGVYGNHPGTSPNNHSHLHKFNGNYYYIYHNGGLLEGMKKAKAVDDKTSTYRSICVNRATVDEETQTIKPVSMTTTGISNNTAIKKQNPYEYHEAETMSTCGGVSYEDFRNHASKPSVNALGNECSINLYVKMAENAWTLVRNVDFGTEGPKSFILKARGSGTLRIMKTKTSEPLATIEFSSTTFDEQVFEVDPAKFAGATNLLFAFSNVNNVRFDAWQFSTEEASGIKTTHAAPVTVTQRYDLSGRRIDGKSAQRGIVIEQYQDANGNKHSRKLKK